MRRILIAVLLAVALQGGAQEAPALRDLFCQMPDSLMPYLSQNNRLDFIDFIDSNMKAEVKNSLDGTSEMTALTADSLSIRMSEALRVDMLLLTPAQAVDSCRQVICLVQTFGTDSISLESQVDFYTPEWRKIGIVPIFSPSDQKRIDALKVQTILKRDEEILKKN